MNRDLSDILFRILFSTIFIGLGGEHIFSDELIQKMMPNWVPAPRLFSILSGIVLVTGGGLIVLGFQLRIAAMLLGAFVIAVTATVHGPALLNTPDFVSSDNVWIWDVLQRSNYVKNLCLLGVCLMLYHYTPGRFSLHGYLTRQPPSIH
ncbi:MAG: DoxX family protein [Verrucomicrobiota bacterium]